MISISDYNKNKVNFIPRFNRYIKNKFPIKFDMYSNFNFESIVNIISLKLITTVNEIFKIFATVKDNSIKFTTDKLSNAKLIIELTTKGNKVKLKNYANAFMKLNAQIAENNVLFLTDLNSKICIRLLAKTNKNKVRLKTQSNDRFVLLMLSKIGIKFNSIASGITKLYARTSNNIIKFKEFAYLNLKFFAKTKEDNKIRLKANASPTIKLFLRPYNNRIKLKNVASATVYKPKMLKELYPDKIGSWYDKSIEEIFYGETLE